ncbi:MAG: S9 family peptidase [Candidatus Eremiobacteraeota bacterium]|nr:S9 family peptidase [Candidatus Eremiobacteraeota bacterium]
MQIIRLVVALAFLLSAVFAAGPASARPVQAEDLFKFTLLAGAQISPDGKWVAVGTQRLNPQKNRYESSLLLVNIASGASHVAAAGPHDGGASWAPDSSGFAFVRPGKDKKPQIFMYRVGNGKIAQLTHAKDGAGGAVFSHDGKHFAYTVVATDEAHPTFVNFGNAGYQPKTSQKKTDVRQITTMHFEGNGAGYVYDQHPHLWIANADGGNARQLTFGTWGENFGGWSPDNRTIAFDSLRYESPSLGPNDIYTIPTKGGAIRKLATGAVSNTGETYANAGDRLWFFSSGVYDPSEYPALLSANADGSDARVLANKDATLFGDSVLADMKEGGGQCGPLFVPGDGSFVINADGPAYANLRTVDATTGTMTDLTPERGEAWSCSMSHGGSIAYLYSDATHPADVYVTSVAGGTPRRITDVNAKLLATLALAHPQAMTVTDPAGIAIPAWFMPAVGGAKGGKHPTILDIHGGPATHFGDSFFQEFQYLSGLGYNVVYSNPRGSTGAGYGFQEALVKNFGDVMFDDVQAVMDEAVKRPDVDAARLGVSGGSYGGFASLWVISHTDRYKVAIAERVVSNLATEQLAADLASDNALGGKKAWGLPWEAGNQYLAQSPVSYVAGVHTPLLILHSGDDIRTPIDQTLQEFNALKILGRTVKYVMVPNETHDLSRTGSPIHRVERLHILANWLNQYLKP